MSVQVTLASVYSLSLSWQVRAERVLATQGPQPYALVVLGRFNGTLQSSANPAAANASAASAPCRIVVVEVTDGPSGLTNQTCAACLPKPACPNPETLTQAWVLAGRAWAYWRASRWPQMRNNCACVLQGSQVNPLHMRALTLRLCAPAQGDCIRVPHPVGHGLRRGVRVRVGGVAEQRV